MVGHPFRGDEHVGMRVPTCGDVGDRDQDLGHALLLIWYTYAAVIPARRAAAAHDRPAPALRVSRLVSQLAAFAEPEKEDAGLPAR
jgi:hypothetical protein